MMRSGSVRRRVAGLLTCAALVAGAVTTAAPAGASWLDPDVECVVGQATYSHKLVHGEGENYYQITVASGLTCQAKLYNANVQEYTHFALENVRRTYPTSANSQKYALTIAVSTSKHTTTRSILHLSTSKCEHNMYYTVASTAYYRYKKTSSSRWPTSTFDTYQGEVNSSRFKLC